MEWVAVMPQRLVRHRLLVEAGYCISSLEPDASLCYEKQLGKSEC